ncbi:tRNA1(Val) A37 N6-methylase TrmN6 [Rhizomicrobium palustre]|uniref:tRNA1(Val) A37 N6-methylase TrmN6 n=1 Tax=Rhizomicrobium palustre TaxID=189966 RepID=A0A846N335_9PROT|nr:methyltransferase [Rhizomicrobium palustre]NIK90146.1 tRNA1(Val) A37 N6-methylase TrmN6 [Rhizomicrobium palustre]
MSLTEDRFLGGRVIIRQPEAGFRAGLDAVMLAAAVPAEAGEEVLELGTGVGTAALCLLTRVAGVRAKGVEIDPPTAELGSANAAANGLLERMSLITGDIFALPACYRKPFDHVFANPPFHGEEGQAAPDPAKARALQDGGRLADWLRAGLKRTVSGGAFTTILRADRLSEALQALPERGISVFPLWPKAGVPAKRVILQARQGARSPMALLPGLVLHEADGRYTPEADAVLRGERGLTL